MVEMVNRRAAAMTMIFFMAISAWFKHPFFGVEIVENLEKVVQFLQSDDFEQPNAIVSYGNL